MRPTICLATALVLCASSSQLSAKPAPFEIKHTSWSYVDPSTKAKARETIDDNGNYIENAVTGKHIDHGTAVMKDGKACFTSAMTKDGERCWTVPKSAVPIGHSVVVTSDKGQKLKVTHIGYTKLEM